MTNDSADHGSPAGPPPGGFGGTGPVPPTAAPRPHGTGNGFFDGLRRAGVQRSSDRWVGGVAGGLAQRFGIDPLLARGIVGVTMLMGFGLVLYGIAWALLPEQSDGRIHLEETIRGRFDVALLGAVALVVLGLNSGDWWFGWGPFSIEWVRGLAWVGVVVAGVLILVNALRRDRGGHRDRPAWQPPAPTGTSPAADPSTRPTAHASVHQEGPTPMSSTGPTTGPAPRPGSTPPPAWSAAPVPPPARSDWAPQPPPPPRPPQHHGRPPQPPRPPKPPRRGPGATITGIVVAVVLLGLAGLLLAERAGLYDGPIASVVLGGGVLLVGLAIIVSGLRGRTAGGLTALAIVGMVLAGPTVAFTDDAHWWGWSDSDRRAFRDVDTVVTSREIAEDGFSFGVGDAELDLSGVPLTGDTLRVPVQGGIGDVRIIVPEGAAVVADVTAGIGSVNWEIDQDESVSGFGNDRTFRSDEVRDGQDPAIELTVEVGVGTITIEED